MALSAEWRSRGESDAILIVNVEDNTVREALAIDPDEDTSLRLLNLVNQKRAQALLDHIDDLFFDPLETEETLP